MRAMILAAGLGTRLRPLTDDRPKALVEVNGRTFLEIALSRLRAFGINPVIINVHHFAGMVVDYLKKNDDFGMRIEISREEILLDTGGGLKKAAWFFLEDPIGEPFLLHNVDVLSTIDFARMLQFHRESGALATLAVQDRHTSRHLLFDENNLLCGRQSTRKPPEIVRHSGQTLGLAFSGVHVISPKIFPLLTEQGGFSVIDSYLRLAAEGENIIGFRTDGYYWRDLGKPENLTQAAEDIRNNVLKI
jgi:NDP-sugar pyrophosphorylase family protein